MRKKNHPELIPFSIDSDLIGHLREHPKYYMNIKEQKAKSDNKF